MNMLEHINPIFPSLTESKIRGFNSYCISQGCNLYLTLGEPDFATPDAITDKAIEALKNHKTKYAPTYGNLELRKAIVDFEKRVNKVDYTTDEVLVTVGSTEAMATALMTILVPGDEVILPMPAYPLYETLVRFLNCVPVKMPTAQDHFQITKENLAQHITAKTKAIIVTSPNNPTGMILSDESLEAIHKAVKDKPIFVISDEVYNQLVYGERRLGFSQYQDIKDHIIVCQSFSKPYAMPGWRIGYWLASKELTDQAQKIHQAMIVCQNTFIQDAAIEALNFDPKPFVEEYQTRRDYILKALKELGFEVDIPEGAFYVFPSIKKFGMTSTEFCEKLAQEEKLALIPSSCFDEEGYIRISYCVTLDKIKEAMARLGHFVSTLK